MKISKIVVRNFRSIQHAEILPNNFNVFVGQNNHGKTNLFEALEWFYQGPSKGNSGSVLHFERQTDNEIVVEVEFCRALAGAERMRNEANKTKIVAMLGGHDSVVVKRTSADEKKRSVYVNGELKKPGTGFDAALNDFLPKFEYISTKHYYQDVVKYGKTTPVGIMLSGVLTTILENNPQYQEFETKFHALFEDESSEIKTEFDRLGGRVKYYLQKQFPDCIKVSFEVTPPAFDELLKNFDTTLDDGIETDASEKGDGMQRALMLSIVQAYAEFRRSNEDIGKSFLFFIDEAEIHLHPSAQRKLKTALLELAAETDQVFINTHSSVFIADSDENQELFKVVKEESATQISEVQSRELPFVVYELLGGSPTDLLLPTNFLLVEGATEIELLTRILIRFYQDKPQIQVIPCRGDLAQSERTIDAIEKVFSVLERTHYRDRLILLYDKPHPTKQTSCDSFFTEKKNLVSNNQAFQLPSGSIEEYYPTTSDWHRTSEQVSAMRGHQKIQLAKRVGSEITQQQFEEEMPQIFNALKRCWELAYPN